MQHNPHRFHIRGIRVGILGDRSRDVGSPFATVTDYFWREDTPWLVLQLPDGRRTAAPAAWTDLPVESFPLIPGRPIDPTPSAELTTGTIWALLPAVDRERFGLRLSRLVLRAVRAPGLEEDT